VLQDPIALLNDHVFLERKAASNAMELMTRWPEEWTPSWVQAMATIARDETSHLTQVMRLLFQRGGQLARFHRNPYANELRLLVRTGTTGDTMDRLFVSALIEARSCERFAVLAEAAAEDVELSKFYKALFTSELGHYKVFLKLAAKVGKRSVIEARWQEMLAAEAEILARQEPGYRIHSGAT
jgi:tRNA-(ms[2]io[6]A)-hydroxylase